MRRSHILAYLALLLVVIVTVAVMQIRSWPTALETYIAGRKFVLAQQARHAPPGMTLIVGDSIVEWVHIVSACEAPVFNAGIMSAGLRDLAPLASELTATLKPARIILAIGTNDAAVGRIIPAADWARDYEQLIASLPRDRVELVAIPATQPGKSASNLIDLNEIAEKNRRLKAIAARLDLAFVPSIHFDTNDGLHPSRAGAATWLDHVEAGCRPSSPPAPRPGRPISRPLLTHP